jgi:LacI family transcriptional regulator
VAEYCSAVYSLALQSKNLQPGKDISVIGFDNVMDAKLVTPSLTTMEVKPYNLGLILAETILRRINEKDHPQITYFNNPELIVRNSTGPA